MTTTAGMQGSRGEAVVAALRIVLGLAEATGVETGDVGAATLAGSAALLSAGPD